MRKVGLYCRELAGWGKGTSEYVAEMGRLLLEHPDPRLDLHLIVPEGCAPPSGANAHIITLPKAHRVIQDHWHAPRLIARAGLEVVWFPKNVTPYGLTCKSIVTIHDLAYFLPEYHAYGFLDTLYMKPMIRRTTRKACHLIADSEHTKQDMVNMLGVPESRITVIYQLFDESFRVIESRETLDSIRRKHSLPEQYIFYAGNLTPRKNIERLLRGFLQVLDEIPHHLVMTGTTGQAAELRQLMEKSRGRVMQLGKVPREDLPAIYNMASIYAHPSLYEGFGRTVVEAQACATPVLNSNMSCMPEVAGEGALYVDPYDTDAIARGLVRLATDQPLRRVLIDKGLKNAQKYRTTFPGRQLQELLASC